ncbi:MAG: antibiotic biosynthesis monooxygenase [Actinobacteria bacterium]|nr:antibiotic biosynthesis monooxygenase [Actinomycetota bacterium]
MSITFILELQVRPDAVDDALDFFRKIIDDTRTFDGCEGIEVLQDADDSAKIVLIEQWASREHQARYTDWRKERGDMKPMVELLVGTARRYLEPTGI